MAKSDINLLQELLIKEGSLPVYYFTENSIDAIHKQFICNVVCKQLTTYGTGSCKKEAKHNAARNMLAKLSANNIISLPTDYTLSPAANGLQSPAKASPSPKQSTPERNYIGMLNEYCQQKKISTKNIQYELVYDDGLPHLKTFTMEVIIGSVRERGIGNCKKSAKQEAARKLLLRLNPSALSSNAGNEMNVPLNANKIGAPNKETLENDIRELGIGILEYDINKETLPVAELSEKAMSCFLESFSQRYNTDKRDINPSSIKDFHILFERNYSNNITYYVKQKMLRIIRDKCINDMDLMYEIRRDIESMLKVKIQQITVNSAPTSYMVCLRLLSVPRVTQFGTADTKIVAEYRATYNLVMAISVFLNLASQF
ncbi:PREDICTED: uncharacterized protein LOC105453502 isoform X2 [Wasmannia auropunctata]|nr:PREDICTED: uncharacterized protein LOC105453502 isoform X2 [Wasmannia auropunctata]XP_011693852.1 PREDICTED: uncharacterized protein LOC105453502 isoform X2 [Wasmannia auropunctata]XP_011693861.1 PREDICTED: uncharacterized protein LOC105453502 isoform X2 [Wasmannia auropunctata]